MAWDGTGTEGKRVIRQGMVCRVRDHGACVLLPAPPASAGGLSCAEGGTAGAIGRGPAGTKGAGASCQSAADHQGRDSGNHGCGPADAGTGTAGDTPC